MNSENGNGWGGGDIAALVAALVKAQSAIRPAVRDGVNPHFKSQYATLSSVWDAIREPLTKNELAVIQQPSTDGNLVSVRTLLLHSSGGWIAAECSATSRDAGPQAVGSVISYLRRYGLAAMVGVVADDDDDAEIAEAPAKPAARKPKTAKPPEEPAKQPKTASVDQVALIQRMAQSHVITERERKKLMGEIADGMTAERASLAIDWLTAEIKKRKAIERAEQEEAETAA